MIPRWFCLLSYGLLLAFLNEAVSVGAQTGPVSFQVYTAEGKQILGPLKNFTPDWGVALAGPQEIVVSGKDFIGLRRAESILSAPLLGPQLLLSSGDRLGIDLAQGVQIVNNQFLVTPASPVSPVSGVTLPVPVVTVAGLWVQAPEGVTRAELFLRQLFFKPRAADVILMKNGDRVEGIFLDLDAKGICKIKVQKKIFHLPFDEVAVLAFSSLFLTKPPAEKPYGHLVLGNGGRLSLASAEIDMVKQKLIGKTLSQATVVIPLQDVAALDLWQGRAVYLSDLKPQKYTHTPFFGVSWPLGLDVNLSGASLKLGPDFFDKGLALHSGSTLAFDLNGQYDWLEVLVGLDETESKGGAVQIGVLVDGKSQDLSGKAELTRKTAPLMLRLPLAQAQQLTLQVPYGSQGDVQGHVLWANARLIKK